MPLFKKKHGATGVERQRQQKELFAFNKTVEHGFPHKPTALAYDHVLKLIAIGTESGVIKIYGTPGVEFLGVHDGDSPVWQLFFLPNQGRVISLLQDNSLHLWEINIVDGSYCLEEVKSYALEGRLKKISVCCLSADSKLLYLGTEGGNIYLLDVDKMELSENIIYQDVVMQNVPDDYKVNPGPVESIAMHPGNPDKLLIGYNRGLIVIWDSNDFHAEHTFVSSQELQNLCWHRDGTQFTSAHNDGSYTVWKADETSPEKEPIIPYGPFPCKPITKLLSLTTKSEPFLIFNGGMPRASYGDRHGVTIIQGKTHTVLDFTSKVIDFFVMSNMDPKQEYDDPHTLVVLAEEEIVFIDLLTEGWPSFTLPYLSALHSSAIISSHHVSNVTEELWDKLIAAGEAQSGSTATQRDWPLNGGRNLAEPPMHHDLLLTGHEDGTIRFWDASTISLKFLYKLDTSNLFLTDADANGQAGGADGEEDEWPPFRKVGTFDPFSDDPRLGIQKIAMCPLTGTLVAAGSAGQVMYMKMGTDEVERKVEHFQTKIVGEQDKFVWRGHEALPIKEDSVKLPVGFQAEFTIQCEPPAAITSLSLQSTWGLTAVGTSHGFALFDNVHRAIIGARCTLNPNDLSATGENLSRKKSFKKSLRASIRRLRRRRAPGAEKPKTSPRRGEANASPDHREASGDADMAPMERRIEARTEESKTSMVRFLYFANTFVRDSHTATPSLWVGTNMGAILIYTLNVPEESKRGELSVSAEIAKEIRLKHGAPVVSLVVVDHDTYPLPDPIEVQNERAKPPNMTGHSVIICTEEQFKVFALPSLKPTRKAKLTAHDGSKVRKVAFINFRSRSNETYSENCITCLTNLGELSIYSIPRLKKQGGYDALHEANKNGIQSLIFTSRGEGFYLLSPSEFERFSLSARNITEPMCMVDLPDDSRLPDGDNQPAAEGGEEVAAAAATAEAEPAAEEQQEVVEEVAAAAEAPEEESAPPPAAPEPEPAPVVEDTPVPIQMDDDDDDDGPPMPMPEQTPEDSGIDRANTVDELVSEVDRLLAESGISMEGETEDSMHEITLDEVKDYGKDDSAILAANGGGMADTAGVGEERTHSGRLHHHHVTSKISRILIVLIISSCLFTCLTLATLYLT
ncbi:LLGL scribble cell polarity complex component 2-like [Amphiura filiformis]|uniref:LLGL scribble cell polarity complex component 2-like n=1 Tax=Amphiura filiformis TaxID=82378 RepID=UPI003B2180EC